MPNDGYGYGIMDLPRAVDASAYPVLASAPNPVYAKYQAWLASPAGRAFAGSGRSSPAEPVTAEPVTAEHAPNDTAIIGVAGGAAVLAAVAVLYFLLRAGRCRSRQAVGPVYPGYPGNHSGDSGNSPIGWR